MTTLYVPPEESGKKIKEILTAFDQAGYDTDNVRFGISWNDFLIKIPNHSTVVVHSLDFFPSLIDLLGAMAQLQERDILIESLTEPWLSAEVGSTTDFLVKLRELALVLHQNRTRAGLAKARASGKTLGRPKASARRGRG